MSKLQDICNSTNKGVFFPLYEAITLRGQGKFQNIDLQLGFSECRVNHIALLESNFQYKLAKGELKGVPTKL